MLVGSHTRRDPEARIPRDSLSAPLTERCAVFVRVCVFTPRAYIVVLPQQGMSIRLSLAYTTGATCSHPQNSVFAIVIVHQ